MTFNTIFFIVMSLLVIGYVIQSFRTQKRMPIILELFFIGAYAFVFVIVLFPETLNVIEYLFGISNALNFIIYISIFIAYFMLFILYQKNETQRVKISKLNREIAFLKKDLSDFMKKKK